jgi:hypothetical protein
LINSFLLLMKLQKKDTKEHRIMIKKITPQLEGFFISFQFF